LYIFGKTPKFGTPKPPQRPHVKIPQNSSINPALGEALEECLSQTQCADLGEKS
jgi:hypothetical protein